MSAPALSVYRRLLRTVGHVFKGDEPMLVAAQKQLREGFEAARSASGAERDQLIEEGSQVEEYIRSSIVQAAMNDRGAYEMAIREEHLGGVVEEVAPGMALPRERKQKPAAE